LQKIKQNLDSDDKALEEINQKLISLATSFDNNHDATQWYYFHQLRDFNQAAKTTLEQVEKICELSDKIKETAGVIKEKFNNLKK
jgi:hypothetical protein